MRHLTVLCTIFLLLSALLLAFHVVYHIPVFYSDTGYEFVRYLDSAKEPSVWDQLTIEEQIHMQDVARIFVCLRLLLLSSIIVTILIITFSQEKIIILKKAIILSGLGLVILVIFLTTFFKQIFLGMHKLLFTNDFWLLPLDSTLITLFPEQTFFIIGLVTLLSTFLFLILLFATIKFAEKNATNANKRKTKRRV